MRAFRSHVALLLILCFTRVLVPDTWILALHPHGHTVHEPAQGKRGKAFLTAQHKHCQTDHFYKAFFQPVMPLEILCLPRYATTVATPALVGRAATLFAYHYLRGPPAG